MKKNITLSDFRELLFEKVDPYFDQIVVGSEIAFEHNIGEGYSIRVLTSIGEGDYTIRDRDAIRVHILDPNGDIVKSTTHTKRTEGYEERVIDKINKLKNCPECGKPTKWVANGEYGDFFYCSEENCEYIQSIQR